MARLYSKITSIKDAISRIAPGSTVLAGGFGICGNPESLFNEVLSQQIGDLTIVSNTIGTTDYGVGVLIRANLVKRIYSSYVGECSVFKDLYQRGLLELYPTPQGTVGEAVRSGGKGLPAFFTPSGVGTMVEYGGFPVKYSKETPGKVEIYSEPKPTAIFNGRKYIQERSIFGDVALIKAYKADKLGNLIYRKSARNCNSDMATAAKIVIAEVEEIVEVGELDGDAIHTPGVFVDHVCLTTEARDQKPIERLVLDLGNGKLTSSSNKDLEKRSRIARRLAKEMHDGSVVNLGIGIPTMIPSFLSADIEMEIHGENGIFGLNGYPHEGEQDPDLINASKESATVKPGASFFSSSDSFGIIRGQHLDWTVLGAMQVSASGDMANWYVPGKLLKGMGGAMDLVSCGSKVAVAMEHTIKGEPKIFEKCTLPLTGIHCVSLLVTDMGVFDFASGRITLKEIAEEYTIDDIKKNTACDFDCYSEIGRF